MTQKEILDLAHHNTLFSQLLSLIPGHVFKSLQDKHNCGRSSRRFGFKQQFAVMAFIHLAARTSLRDGLRCLAASGKRLYHLGLRSIASSTVADANRDRPVIFFKELFERMYQTRSNKAPGHGFRFNAKLFSLDSSTVSLCLSVFPWAAFRSGKAGIKMHTVLDHDGHIPAFVDLTEAKVHDSQVSKVLRPPKGSIVVFDRGCNDYRWFGELTGKGIDFVTRLKSNAVHQKIQVRPLRRQGGPVKADHVIEVTRKGQSLRLRCVDYRDPDSGRLFKFITNNFKLSPQTIADIYKDRWKIELFFKEIKQNPRIKRFVGTSENAVWIQLYTAMTLYLLLAFQKFLCSIGISVQKIFQLLQLNIFAASSISELLYPPPLIPNNIPDFPLLELIRK
jgi:hypothetical protein